jgi:hypothetical protein
MWGKFFFSSFYVIVFTFFTYMCIHCLGEVLPLHFGKNGKKNLDTKMKTA